MLPPYPPANRKIERTEPVRVRSRSKTVNGKASKPSLKSSLRVTGAKRERVIERTRKQKALTC